ncbi:MAG: hypothetical protein IT536_16460 [Hyphomicrobiales bacterium]|nr:hypothetical protein [Hyphomicrobiales bacterium]
MTTIALLVHRTPALLERVAQRVGEFLDGIAEARTLAHRFQVLSQMTDAQLAARGLRREDIPQAVLDTRLRA